MEGNRQFSPKLGYPVEGDDVKYVSRLSTILVATIQEAKDRISQIEYIFCSQLYSNFQTKSKSLQKIYLEAKEEAEDSWKEKEKDLLLQIERLQFEKQQVLEENQCLKLEQDKSLGDLDEQKKLLALRERNQQIRIVELEEEVRKKSKEVDEGMELQNRLLQLVQTKSSVILDKGKQLKEYEEKTKGLLAKGKSLEDNIEQLEREVKQKTEKVEKKKKDLEEACKTINKLMSQVGDCSHLLTKHEKEKKELVLKLERLEEDVSKLQKKLEKKTQEIVEGRVARAELLQQIDMNNLEILKQKQQLVELENDKRLLLEKVSSSEEKINELQENFRSRKEAEGENSFDKLLQQIEIKDSQLLAWKKEKKDLFDKYKSLKSQYRFLLSKCGLTEENMLPQIKLEHESGLLKHQENPTTSPACEVKKVKLENDDGDGLENDKVFKSNPMLSFHSPTSNYIAPKCPPTAKSVPIIGSKRPASRWVDTRSRQYEDGLDPHDDFLDTPLEKLKGTLNKTTNEKVLDLHIPVQKDIHADSADDETQDMNVDPGPGKQQMPLPTGGHKGFKYVEPVRKKAERDNLPGVECKQCKKFYDAVLPNGGKDTDGNKQNFRCEHHDGVSRHRYKYVPPLTPEGFWNIGFESEM